jgi:hypothetical protein
MTVFQWIAVPLLSLVLLVDLLGFVRTAVSRKARLFRCLVWLAAIVAILYPDLLQTVATAVGIQRGADLVMYVFILAFLAVSFYFYARYVRLQRQITDLVRHIAIQQARREPQDGLR